MRMASIASLATALLDVVTQAEADAWFAPAVIVAGRSAAAHGARRARGRKWPAGAARRARAARRLAAEHLVSRSRGGPGRIVTRAENRGAAPIVRSRSATSWSGRVR
jgi:hypothetical protein